MVSASCATVNQKGNSTHLLRGGVVAGSALYTERTGFNKLYLTLLAAYLEERQIGP